jgi:ABC-type antimicrobial peptide transport system permease subunit
MRIFETARTGFGELWSHKTRSLLSFFAISIGTAAFMYTFASISGLNRRMANAIKLSGPGKLMVENERNYDSSSQNQKPQLSYDDAVAIRRDMPWLYMVSPIAANWGRKFLHGNTYARASVLGITPEWSRRDWVYKLRGRFITDSDMTGNARVCVLIEDGDWTPGKKKPAWARMSMWDYADPVSDHIKHYNMLGENVGIDNHEYKVVGIIKQPPLDDDPRWFRMGYGEQMLIPITTMLHFMPQQYQKGVQRIDIDTGDEKTLPLAKHQLTVLLKNRHSDENFKIRSLSELFQQALANWRKQSMTILAIGIVAILSGGIGIMNVTLATVFSRIKEIGIRRAIGATKSDIMLQFITEAVLLGFLGGVFGILLGYGFIQYSAADDWELKVFIWWVPAVSVLIAVATGFLFSLYPAYTAAKLDPVEALRYE